MNKKWNKIHCRTLFCDIKWDLENEGFWGLGVEEDYFVQSTYGRGNLRRNRQARVSFSVFLQGMRSPRRSLLAMTPAERWRLRNLNLTTLTPSPWHLEF